MFMAVTISQTNCSGVSLCVASVYDKTQQIYVNLHLLFDMRKYGVGLLHPVSAQTYLFQ